MDKLAYISIVLAFLTGVGLSSMYSSDLQPKVTINDSEGDVYRTNNIEPPRYNYIQPTYRNVNYSFVGGDSVRVDDVDSLVTLYGSSMRPTIFTGNKILVTDYRNQSLSEGDIVSANGVTHRIKANYVPTNGYFLTQGDNNEVSERVEPSEIDGVVLGVLFTGED